MLISESTVAKLLEIERAFTAIVNSGISGKRLSKYNQESVIDSLFYLGKIFFPKITRTDAKRLSKAKDIPEYLILTNFRKALEYVKYQSEFSPVTAQIANHLNRILTYQIIDNWQPRNINLKTKYDDEFDFTKIKPDESETIENIVMLTQKTDLSVLRATELFQYVVKFKPFNSFNDITALLLAVYEYTRFYGKLSSMLSITKVLLSEDNLDDIIMSNDTFNALISGIFSDITYLKDRILKHSYQDKVDKNSQYSDLSERQLALLRYLQNSPTINRRQYMKLFKVSTMTAFRDLNELVDKKIIRVKGVGRGTYYEIVSG